MINPPRLLTAVLGLTFLLTGCSTESESSDMNPKPATPATIEANEAMLAVVEKFNAGDFEAAAAGRIAELPEPIIKSQNGEVVWDTTNWDFLDGDAPDTVNPSLWRLQKLNSEAGLFEVTDGIYQFRGYDMANMVLIEGDTGWIVVDSTSAVAPAKAGLELAMQTLNSTKPVVAVIYTHSHADHFGGVRGLVDEADVTSGKVKIYAPDGFMNYAIAENVLAGNAMTRRGQYQFGMLLPEGPQGTVGTALGLSMSTDPQSPSFIPPTDYITTTGEELTIDGVRIQFQMANGTEAPAQMMFYFPDKQALCTAEVVNQLMHNVLAMRGAQVRDSLRWSKVINESIDLFPDAQVAFGLHHWPIQGQENVKQWLTTQRDTYRFIHDRALNLLNQGQTMSELANEDFFPEGLAAEASSRGYYGTLSHNLRAVYQFYLGNYDANPANLDPLPRAESAERYVEVMGGEEAVLEAGQQAFDDGDYKWTVELVNNVVFANPDNVDARALQADALEQLGYQAESATWRNAYLMGAQELRQGKQDLGASTLNPDTVRGMTNELLFDFIALSLDHEKTDGAQAAIQMEFTDLQETWALELSNSVLNNTKGRELADPDLKISLTRPAFLALMFEGKPLAELVQAGQIQIEGDPSAFGQLSGAVVEFDPTFAIVTPPAPPAEGSEQQEILPPIESGD